MSPIPFAALVTAVFVSACGGASDTSGDHVVVDSAGVRIVTSQRALWGAAAVTLDTAPLLRIGSDEAGPDMFSFIGPALLLPDGRIGVAEMLSSELRFFSESGVSLGSIGGRGRGPGEYQSLSGVFAYGADSLITYDQILRRTIVRASSGGTGRVLANPIAGNLFAFGVMNNTQVLLYDPGTFRRDANPGLQWDTTDVALFDVRDGSGRVIARLPSRQRFYEGGDARLLSPAQHALFAATATGFCWVASDRYDIRCFDGDGKLTQIIRRPVEAGAVDAAMMDRWIEAGLAEVRQREGEAGVARSRPMFDAAVRGEHVPLFEHAFVDRDERLWLGESTWPELQTLPRRWSIFRADGVWLGDLEVPSGFRVLDSHGDLVLGVWPDADELPRVQLHTMLTR